MKHKREYDMLIEETAQRAYGGVSSCQVWAWYGLGFVQVGSGWFGSVRFGSIWVRQVVMGWLC